MATDHLGPLGGENTLGSAMEEPWREIKHNAVHFPIDWEDVVIHTASFGQGSSVPEETFTTKVRSHQAFDSAQRPGSTRAPTTHKGSGEAKRPGCPAEVQGLPE